MALTLVFADCEVAYVVAADDRLVVRLSAAHARAEPAAGDDRPTDGFARGVVVTLKGARLAVPAGTLIGRIAQGRIRIGTRWADALPLPGRIDDRVRVELAFANRSELDLEVDGIEVGFDGEPNFAESLFC
jgi:hypothetical protein